MTTTHPPRLALWLLNRMLPAGDPLTGDLVEEFTRRRSSLWFWRQTAGALLAIRERYRSGISLGLGEHPDAGSSGRSPRRHVNLTASPLQGIGGLGLLALAFIVSVASPGSWLVALAILLQGLVLGAVLAYVRRRRGGSGAPPVSPLTRE